VTAAALQKASFRGKVVARSHFSPFSADEADVPLFGSILVFAGR
jgi:hypothetical protein